MELFKLTKNQVAPSPGTLLISEFKAVWDRDKSKDKELALKELGFIYYIADYKSVYLSTPPEEREDVLKEDLLLPDKWKPDAVIKTAISKYNDLQEVPTMRLLNATQDALEQLVIFFRNLKMSDRDRAGKPLYRPSEITKAMSETAKVAESLDTLREKVKRELDTKGKLRGGGELGHFEEP